jgi:hypothetical protein
MQGPEARTARESRATIQNHGHSIPNSARSSGGVISAPWTFNTLWESLERRKSRRRLDFLLKQRLISRLSHRVLNVHRAEIITPPRTPRSEFWSGGANTRQSIDNVPVNTRCSVPFSSMPFLFPSLCVFLAGQREVIHLQCVQVSWLFFS